MISTFERVGGMRWGRRVTKPVTLQVEYLGHVRDPWGGERAIFSAHGTLNREDWGLTWNMILDNGGFVVSNEIRLEIDLEAVRKH